MVRSLEDSLAHGIGSVQPVTLRTRIGPAHMNTIGHSGPTIQFSNHVKCNAITV